MNSTEGRDSLGQAGLESLVLIAYFAGYLGYLFFHLESEAGHWLSLVLLPLLVVHLSRRRRDRAGWRNTLASIGLRRGNLTRGLLMATAVGLLIGIAQVLVSERADEIIETLRDPGNYWRLPVIFVLMLATAATTEEVFFRGCLQTRLGEVTGRRWVGVLAAAVLFGLYHVPYAYLHPGWPSHGDWAAAWQSAMFQGVLGGVILGIVYERARHNLVAPIVTHALINTLPAIDLLRISFG